MIGLAVAATLATSSAAATPQAAQEDTWRLPHQTFLCRLSRRSGVEAEVMVDFSGDQSDNSFAFFPSLHRYTWPRQIVFHDVRNIGLEATDGVFRSTFAGSRVNDGSTSSFELIWTNSPAAKFPLSVRLTHDGDEARGDCSQMPRLPKPITED